MGPAFVVQGWGARGAEVKVDGRLMNDPRSCRVGLEARDGSPDLVVWLALERTKPVSLELLRGPPGP